MDNTLDPADKASFLTVDDTPDNLAPISARLKDSDPPRVARRTRR